MVDPAASEDAKVQTLLSACARHAQLGNESAAGKGCDRHMFGLRKMAADGPMPDIFTDPSFAASCNWVLSTSHCGSENLSVCCGLLLFCLRSLLCTWPAMAPSKFLRGLCSPFLHTHMFVDPFFLRTLMFTMYRVLHSSKLFPMVLGSGTWSTMIT